MLGELPTRPARMAPSGPAATGVPTLTIAIPDSLLAMPSHDPWAHGGLRAGGRPVERPDSELAPETVANDEGYAAALRHQVERDRRASVVSAAAAATKALSDAADSAAAEPAPVPYARRAPPPSFSMPPLMSLPTDPTVVERGGIVISGPVTQPMSVRERMLPHGAAERDQTDLDLPLAGDGVGIPAEALRRVMRVLSAHFGEMASEILMRAAPRAGTIPELHTLLVAQAGGGIDKKKLAKQLRAIAKLPL
jgi:hypothetical protein